MALIVVRNRVIICLLFLLSAGPFANASFATAQSSAILPVLTSAVATSLPADAITVSGNGFSGGGLVYVALYDQWGMALQETRWTSASPTVYGLNGSLDPANGFREGGSITEVFEQFTATVYGPNGSQDPAQGYHQGNDALDVTGAIYGPNGSQDPAQGYIPGSSLSEAASTYCEQALMARAFDQNTASWSNLVDVASGC